MHYYQFNIADYRKDTAHLSALEHYIYRSLIDQYYLDEAPIPKETQPVIRRLCLGSDSDKLALQNVLTDFFTESDDGWVHDRIEWEIVEYQKKVDKNRLNGAKGGRPKGKKNPVGSQSVPSGNPLESQINPNHKPLTTNQEPNKEDLSGSPDDTHPKKADAIKILAFLNEKTGRKYKPVDANINKIMARFKEGYTPRELCQIIAKKTREWMHDESMSEYLRPATLFGREKCAQYSGELGQQQIGDSEQ